MRGVSKKQVSVIAEDERRRIFSIMNGELNIRDIHLLEMKKGDVEDGFVKLPLGNHYHTYREVCYCYKGRALYKLKNVLTGEEEEMELNEGEVMYRDGFIAHTCICTEDCILIDGAEQSWIEEDWNHYPERLM